MFRQGSPRMTQTDLREKRKGNLVLGEKRNGLIQTWELAGRGKNDRFQKKGGDHPKVCYLKCRGGINDMGACLRREGGGVGFWCGGGREEKKWGGGGVARGGRGVAKDGEY